MSEAALTLLGTALIVAVPSFIGNVKGRRRDRKIEATHEAVQVLNGNANAEPLGEYIHRQFHLQGARFEMTSGFLRHIDESLAKLVTLAEQERK